MPDLTTAELPTARPSTRTLIESITLGTAYGVVARFANRISVHSGLRPGQLTGRFIEVMGLSFLILVPVMMGMLTVRRAARGGSVSGWFCTFAPWASVSLTFACAMLFLWEGAICIAMAAPIALLFSSVGGLLTGIFLRYRLLSRSTTVSLALLPFLLSPAESLLPAPTQTRAVASEILIHAPAAIVWHNIKRVPAIAPTELRATWAQRIGFPRPVEATLSYEGIGGIRHATFEHGLLFLETVTAWEPEHRLAFSIRADTAHIPPTTLDEHVTIGGRYFDVLDGEYRLESRPDGDILLHLTSHQRLSTDFNGYAGLWSDSVMQNLQSSILEVIRKRCETPPATVAQSPTAPA